MASKVTGYRETARAIRKVGQFPRAKVGQASRKALTPMLRATKANLKSQGSYHRGVLYRSLKIRKLKSTSALSQWVLAPTDRGVAIGHLVEGSVRPHWQPKRGRMHPGYEGKPFMQPAFESHDDEAIAIMARELGDGIVRFAAQVAYRGR